MNTPKLISLLSSAPGSVDPSRFGKANDPVHGLDFSRLLGEKRSQSAAAAVTPRPQPSSHKAQAGNQARVSTAPAHQNTPQHAPARASDTPSASRPQESTGAATQPEQNLAPEQAQSNTPAGSETPASSTPQAQAAEAPRDSAAHTTDTIEQAQAVAEAGLVGPAIAAAALPAQAPEVALSGPSGNLPQGVAAALPGTEARANIAPTANPHFSQLPTNAPESVAAARATALPEVALATAEPAQVQAAPSQPPAGLPATAGTPLTPLQTRPAQALSGLETAAPVAAAPSQAATQEQTPLPPAPGAASALSQLQAATLPAGNTEAGATLAGKPAASLDARVATIDTPLVNALPLSGVTDTAAARSLQDFTAMVAAARASSGTALPSSTALASQAAGAPSAMAALFPSLLPGQAPLASSFTGTAIAAPLGSPQWSAEFGRQFISIAQAANPRLGQVAELRLDPPELGPLRITINLNDNVAHAVFSSPHALVRQTVENALPQLQQMLEQAGISLGEANVNDEHQSGQPAEPAGNGSRLHTQSGAAGDASDNLAEAGSRIGRPADPNALVDTFA